MKGVKGEEELFDLKKDGIVILLITTCYICQVIVSHLGSGLGFW